MKKKNVKVVYYVTDISADGEWGAWDRCRAVDRSHLGKRQGEDVQETEIRCGTH